MEQTRSQASDWQQPAREESGLREYVATIRERIWLIVGAVLICLVAAVGYLLVADRVYEARAELLVSPVPADDPLLASLGLIRQSSDPTRDVETAATLAQSIDVAARASEELGGAPGPQTLLDDVTAEPVATSNIIAITASAESPQAAADVANAMAQAVVDDRTEALHEQVETQLSALTEDGATTGGSAQAEVSQLEILSRSEDPTIRVETEAVVPDEAASPNVRLTLGAALLAGLVIGGIAAFGSQALDPRLRREEQLRSRFKLPILARVPKEQSRRNAPMAPGTMSQAASEAYRTLRANLLSNRSRDDGLAQTIMVTGSAPSEGKTTTAINLAASFVLTGARVIVIEADLRRPSVGETLGLEPPKRGGTAGTLLGNVELEDALVTSAPFGEGLKLLLADYRGAAMSELFSLRAAERLLREAQELADIVIIDSPPLTAVVDTLPLARQVDDVLIVCRLGLTRLDRLSELSELLASNGVAPTGFALIEVTRSEGSSSYYYRGNEAGGRETSARRGREPSAASGTPR
ncbi:AAA family ATPase [Thermoleophilia bacterium SCSIO 60948]|nr:AAA family ATPase [Thermoleophilia bacterium SCSIO 60948]